LNGALWAALSGVGFGVFQVVNARAVRHETKVYLGTFSLLLTATVVLAAIVLAGGSAAELVDIPGGSLAYLAAAGMVHFFVGWTTLNVSQARIGAARTSPLIATMPIFGVLIAFATGSVPGLLALLGIAVTAAGAYVVSDPGTGQRASLRDSGFGLATAAAWAMSAVLTVAGLRGVDDPLVGVTVGLAAATLAYGAVLLAVSASRGAGMGGTAWRLKLVAGVVVALATWWRFLGLADAPVGVVLALQLLTVPTVLLLVSSGRHREPLTLRVWLGSAAVLAGVAVLIAGRW
jgi:drug/metabolite transporter (DMT)-like permease